MYIYIYTGWWFQSLWKILVNEKDYPIYYGKIKVMFQTTNQIYNNIIAITIETIWNLHL